MKELYSLYISLGALAVSVFSLGWNFYRDVILKPRLKVEAAISNVVQIGRDLQTFISISAVDLGPGTIICNGILGKKRHLFRLWKRKNKRYFYVVEDFKNPLNKPFPQKLEVGDTLTQLLPYNKEAFLSLEPTHIGFRDTFGRMHWASRKSLKEAKKQFLKEFKKRENGPQ